MSNKEDNKKKLNIFNVLNAFKKRENPNKLENSKKTNEEELLVNQKNTKAKKVLKVSKSVEENCNQKPQEEQKSNFNKKIENQLKEISPYQNVKITEDNMEKIEILVFAAENLVNDCVDDDIHPDNNFINLMYIYQKVSLKIETYKLEKKQKEIEKNKKK